MHLGTFCLRDVVEHKTFHLFPICCFDGGCFSSVCFADGENVDTKHTPALMEKVFPFVANLNNLLHITKTIRLHIYQHVCLAKLVGNKSLSNNNIPFVQHQTTRP